MQKLDQFRMLQAVFLAPLLCILSFDTNLFAQQNGISAAEAGAISPVNAGTDYLWADSGGKRWKLSLNGGSTLVLGVWGCPTQLGGIVYSGSAPVGSDTNAEFCLSLPGTIDPGVPLLVGSVASTAPRWGGTSAISLNLQNWASVSEVANDPTTGTVVNTLAKISSTGAIQAGTSDAAVPTYVVVTGAGKTSPPAQLAISGQASCIMDTTHLTGSVEGQPVFASTTTGGDCTTLATAPLGTWVVGSMISSTTTAGSAATILVRPGYLALTSSFVGSGTSLVSATSLSNSSGTELATASGTLTSGDLAKFNGSGDVADSGIALASISGSTTIAATANSNLTSTASGDLVTVDSSGNVQDSGTTPCLIQNANAGFLIPPYIFFPPTNPGGSPSALETTANRVFYIQFYLPCKATLRHVSINVFATSSGSVVLGFYSCGQSACTNTSPIVSNSSVSLSCSGSGVVTGSTSSNITLEPGIYAFAYGATDTTCAVSIQTSAGWMTILNQNSSKRQGYGTNGISGGALQSTLGTLNTNNEPIVYSLWEP
ncbi:MAG TPA: hypothetical protein VNX26_04520 [Candidatus Acidoferrum sp.]|jgi:hypothetical protein|nr:hypothetical protein [Candidatus Acidoferrum sp.]